MAEETSMESSSSAEPFAADASFPLSSRYGLNAWRRWNAAQSSEVKEEGACKKGEKTFSTRSCEILLQVKI